MSRPCAPSRRRGFTIIEMLAALILLAAFFVVGGKLFYATFRTAQNVSQAQDAAASFDAALSVLRADVWSAHRIDVSNPQTVTLMLDGERRVSWTITATAASRIEGDRAGRWTIPPNTTLKSDGPALVLIVPELKTSAGGEIRLTNQLQLVSRLSK